MRLLRVPLPLVLAAALAAPLIAQDGETTNMEILRQKVKADKKFVVATNIELTEAETKAFWPVYDAYQKDLDPLNQRLKAAILAYADAYTKGPISNETSKKLLVEVLATDEAEVKLKQSYVPKLEAVLPEAKVLRYLQIENKIRAAVRYELAGAIPLAR